MLTWCHSQHGSRSRRSTCSATRPCGSSRATSTRVDASGGDPAALVAAVRGRGRALVHVVDLDGARGGRRPARASSRGSSQAARRRASRRPAASARVADARGAASPRARAASSSARRRSRRARSTASSPRSASGSSSRSTCATASCAARLDRERPRARRGGRAVRRGRRARGSSARRSTATARSPGRISTRRRVVERSGLPVLAAGGIRSRGRSRRARAAPARGRDRRPRAASKAGSTGHFPGLTEAAAMAVELALGNQPDHAERRQGHLGRERLAVPGSGSPRPRRGSRRPSRRSTSSRCSHLLPAAARGHADAVAVARHRREVADADERPLGPAEPREGEHVVRPRRSARASGSPSARSRPPTAPASRGRGGSGRAPATARPRGRAARAGASRATPPVPLGPCANRRP